MYLRHFLFSFVVCAGFFFGTVACNEDSPVVPNPPDVEEPQVPEDTIPEIKPPQPESSILKYLYDIEALPSLTLEIPTEEWNLLLAYFDQNPMNEENIKGNITFVKGADTYNLSDIGIRLRGNTSRRRPEGDWEQMHNADHPEWHHVHFALNFKKFVKGQTLAGAEKLNLKWFKDDACYVREVYCYDLFKRFGVWTAPRSSYCRLYIKIKEDPQTIYYGVYELLEPIDKEYLKNRNGFYSSAEGNLWKANYGADLAYADKNLMGIEDVTLTYTYKPVYDLKTNEKQLEAAKTELAAFITNLKNKKGDDFKTWIGQATDVPLLLKTYAVNVICGMWDDYWNNKNNFYFYFDPQGKFYFIPYDYDNTLGTSLLMDDAGRQDVLRWGNDQHPLIKKLLEIPEYRTMYISYLQELADSKNDYFYVDKSIARIQQWQNRIRNFISNDTGEDMYLEDRPAGWGNRGEYRLLERNNNFFRVRGENLPK
ncbi:MAG: CotH kinase family protein [Dysgonamonadaceae bacterium]|jgi:spore coat protein CotH|nr:CotH kinase family protein [Dysgonamonadaceae bacterium]